jgi:hypothetical protein
MHIKRYEMTVRQDEEGRFYYTDAQPDPEGYWIRYEDMIDYIKWLDSIKEQNCVDAVLAKCREVEQATGIDWMTYEPPTLKNEGSPGAL